MRRSESRDDRPTLTPARALLQPAWLGALALLVINDHVLKDMAALAPLTGKLSDVAGLFLAPVLLAALLRVRRRRGLLLSAGLVGAVFAAINLSPAAAGVWDQAMATVGFPWTTYPDPTDCLALAMLPVSVTFFDECMRQGWRSPRRRIAAVAVAGLGTLACAGSTGPGPGPEPDPVPTSAQFQSRVALLNKTHELQIVQVRKLADDVHVDCDRVAEAPQEYLRAEAFGDPVRWELATGQQIGLSGDAGDAGMGPTPSLGNDECDAARVVVDIAPDIVVFWDGDLEQQSYVQYPDGDKDDLGGPQTVALNGDYSGANEDDVSTFGEGPCVRQRRCAGDQRREAAAIPEGAEYAWGQQGDDRLFFEIPSRTERDRDDVPRRCRRVIEQPGLAWETLPTDRREVLAIDRGADGCHRIALAPPNVDGEELDAKQHIVCAPWEAIEHLSPLGDDRHTVVDIEEFESTGNSAGIRFDADILEGDNDGYSLDLTLTYGTHPDRMFPLQADVVPKEGCGPIEAQCSQMDVPGELRFGPDNIEGTYGVGDSVQVNSSSTVHVVRAFERSVIKADSECEDDSFITSTMPPEPSPYVEAAIVTTRDGTR